MSGKFVLKIEQSPILHTKFGTAKINKNGYYQIITGKEGNHLKLLHRLIFEDYYGPLNDNEVCHHRNGSKTDNCVYNFQRMDKIKHDEFHMKGENNHNYGKSYLFIGENNPKSKYHNLWDNSIAEFNKRLLFTKNGDIGKAFRLRYNGKRVNCGLFIDPLSCEIINNIIKGEEE